MREVSRTLVFIALVLYAVSSLASLGEALGCSNWLCTVYPRIGLVASLAAALAGSFVLSLYGCPLLLPVAGAAGAAAALGLLDTRLALGAALGGLAASAVLRRGEPGLCVRGLASTLATLVLGLTFVEHLALLQQLGVGLTLLPGGLEGLVVRLHARLAVPGLSAFLLSPLVALGLASMSVSVAAGLLMTTGGLAAAYLQSFSPIQSQLATAIVGGLAGLASASIVLAAGGGEEAGRELILPERPAGRTERIKPSPPARRGKAGVRGAAATTAAQRMGSVAQAASPSGVAARCRGRRLREFVELAARTSSPEWRRFFEECLRGRSVYGYRIEALLGVGADGIVFRARDEDTGALAALKMILPEPIRVEAEDSRRTVTKAVQLIESLEREGASLRELSAKSPYIVRVKAIHTDAEKFKLAIRRNSFDIYIKNPPSIIMEYMAGGSVEKLLDLAKPGDSDWLRVAAVVIASAASALKVIHESGYVHNDVKPANILLSSSLPGELSRAASVMLHALREPEKAKIVPKLSDLGVASRSGEPVKGFTPLYAAPEILLYEATCLSRVPPPDAKLCSRPLVAEPSQDIYSLGVVALQLLTGARRKLLASYMQLVRDNPLVVYKLLEGKAPREVAKIVARMLSNDPRKRPNAGEVERFFRRYALAT